MTIVGGALLALVEAGAAEAGAMLDAILQKIPERKQAFRWLGPAQVSGAGGAVRAACAPESGSRRAAQLVVFVAAGRKRQREEGPAGEPCRTDRDVAGGRQGRDRGGQARRRGLNADRDIRQERPRARREAGVRC